jgi:hypothetical protein
MVRPAGLEPAINSLGKVVYLSKPIRSSTLLVSKNFTGTVLEQFHGENLR